MGRPEKDGRCKKHPTHKNLNGVCPFCLRDRLANISGSSINNKAVSSTSSASSTAYSSYDSDDGSASSVASPPERSRKRLFQLLKGKNRTLKSSRSFSISKEKEEKRKSSKKGAGRKLWAKLVNSEGGRKNQADQNRSTLSHSKTVKEIKSAKWTFFS